jgi:branched-chain amino acid transport system permease protein
MLNVILAALIVGLIFAILSMSSDLLIGYTGLMVMNQAAMMAVGAYAAALLSLRLGWPPLLCMLAGALIAGVSGVLVALPAFRLSHDYFLIATLASQIAIVALINNWISLTRGPLGLYGLQRPAMFSTLPRYFLLTLLVASAALLLCWWLSKSYFGVTLQALRDDQVSLEGLGTSIIQVKIEAMFIACTLMGLAGGLYAFYLTSLDPFSFAFSLSVLVLSMVVIGGAGNVLGTAAAGVLLVGIPEGLRYVGLSTVEFAQLRQMAYGALMVAFIMYRPRGLWGRRPL